MQNLVLEILKKEKPYLEQQFGVTEIGLFGSFARGDNMPDSDIDIIVKVQKISFVSVMGILNYLAVFNRRLFGNSWSKYFQTVFEFYSKRIDVCMT
ncbi:MAG: nucleotidyltransferase domain-containing protein [Bacteroidetes bacterium]|nr:nucleotidyltransferase domain-containing protein [Bacteroidota bacterium]